MQRKENRKARLETNKTSSTGSMVADWVIVGSLVGGPMVPALGADIGAMF